jgi:hypothetical protein
MGKPDPLAAAATPGYDATPYRRALENEVVP